MAAVLTGARSQSLDVSQALLFRAKRFAGQRQGSEFIYREVRDRQNAPAEDKERARSKMEIVRQELTDRMSANIQSAQRLGLSQGEAISALLAGGLGETDAVVAPPTESVGTGQLTLRDPASWDAPKQKTKP